MKQAITIITGGGTGIGSALAKKLMENGHPVLIVGRREEPLINTIKHNKSLGQYVVADLATEAGRQTVVNKINPGQRVRALVNNAAVLDPVCGLQNLTLEKWRYHMQVNVEAPLFLTKLLIKQLKNGRVINISSGAATSGIPGWTAYCTAKAAFLMVSQMMQLELKEYDILTTSVRPGVVDTSMQRLIRNSDEKHFPGKNKFIKLYESGDLVAPEKIANFLYWLIIKCSGTEFEKVCWDYNQYNE